MVFTNSVSWRQAHFLRLFWAPLRRTILVWQLKL